MKNFRYRLFCFSYTVKQWLTRRFTTSGLAVFVCLVISAIVGIDTKQTMAYQIFTFLVSIVVMAMVYSLRFPLSFSANRSLPKFASVGVKLRYTIIIENQTSKIQKGLKLLENFADPRPNLAEFKQTVEAPPGQTSFIDRAFIYYRWLRASARKEGAITNTVDLPNLLPRSQTKVVVEMLPLHRGVVRLTGVTLARSDPFGLFNAFKTIALPQSLLILPKRYELPPIQLPGARRYQSGGVSLTSSVGDSAEFMSLRDYRPGDPLRKIHWKSWAKINKPVVREEQDEFFVRHALILDTFQTNKYSEILEEAIEIAASFTCNLPTQESLLDLMFIGLEAYCFTAGRGLGNQEKMLELLASVNACQDKSFDYLTKTVMTRVSMLSGCICILIDWDEARKKLISYLQELGIPTLVLVVVAEKQEDKQEELYLENLHWLKLGKIQEGLMKL